MGRELGGWEVGREGELGEYTCMYVCRSLMECRVVYLT